MLTFAAKPGILVLRLVHLVRHRNHRSIHRSEYHTKILCENVVELGGCAHIFCFPLLTTYIEYQILRQMSTKILNYFRYFCAHSKGLNIYLTTICRDSRRVYPR